MSRNQQFFAAAFSLAFVAGAARAQSEASTLNEVSALPLASVASGPSVCTALSAGAVFVIDGVETAPFAATYTLQRVSDRTRVGIEVSTRGARPAVPAVGTLVTAKAISTGIVLTADRDAIAFVPNALGEALLRNERLAA